MCGIAGIVDIKSGYAPQKFELEAMAEQLRHRGPDGKGFYLHGQVGLAHTRLSIIDLEGGAQPIHNENKSVWVVFNGEIFNYVELRKQLLKLGHQFYTHSDTEVIVHLYEQYGEKFVDHLNGQFAIALWDVLKQQLILVRDRVGIVPLFYSFYDGRLIFASEVKALLPVFRHSPQLNLATLDQLMTFWAPVSPNTLFDGVLELSPGEMMIIKDGHQKKLRYWDWQFPCNAEDYAKSSEEQLAEELHNLLIDATQIRLRSDVPVGAYLSGGLDSSVLVSMIQNFSDTPLHTFSLGFESESLDESSYQKLLIEHLDVKNSKIQCSDRDVGEQFMDSIWHTESPVLRTAPAPMQLLSGLVRENNYKVVLTGEGADEVLGGYDIFKEAKIRQFWAQHPDSRWRALLLKKLYPYLETSSGQAQSYLQNYYGVGLNTPELPYFSHLPRWDTTSKAKMFFSNSTSQQLEESALDRMSDSLPAKITHWHPFNRSQYIEAKSLMGGYLLCSQGDRMLMANSVEGRFPFLDHRVIEFANRLPPKFKMKVLNEKYLLKKAMAKYLPANITKRHKQPYRAPDIPAFFGHDGKTPQPYVGELLSEDKLKENGYFDSKRVGMLVKKARRGGAISYKDNQALVSILSTQIWHFHFIENYMKNFNTINR